MKPRKFKNNTIPIRYRHRLMIQYEYWGRDAVNVIGIVYWRMR